MGLLKAIFDFVDEINKNEEDEKMKKLEKEMDWNNLDDYEKEEVRKGHYDIYNFEDSMDEDLDEDDYYSEDDK